MVDKMFKVDGVRTPTYNPYTGCMHDCVYCYARDIVLNLQQRQMPKYAKCGFKPTFHVPDVQKAKTTKYFKPNKTYFVCSLGDMWGVWVSDDYIDAILDGCEKADQSTTFLFLTKNPRRYFEYFETHRERLKPNYVLGATIESNRDYIDVSKAPSTIERFKEMKWLKIKFPNSRQFLSIEPILDFDISIFNMEVRAVAPEFVYIGYDNHEHRLKEPYVCKTYDLIRAMQVYTDVRQKTIRERWY